MPKQIKKPKLKPYDRKYRKSVVGMLIATVIFLGALFGLIKIITDTEGKLVTTILFGAYILYIAACGVSLTYAVKAYKNEDNFNTLFQGFFITAALVFCAMNLRFAFVMLFSAYNLDELASKLMGTATSTEFVSTQYMCWICMLIGTLLTIILGILGIVKLAKNREK